MIVGIVGAGNMGTGIAKAFAMNDGFTVYLCDSNELIANKAKRRIGKELEYSVERGRYTKEQADAMMKRIVTGTKYICEEADLVIECIYEDVKTKKETLKELDKICKPECLLCTNTSRYSITELGAGLSRPLTGMHFQNPATTMKLVDVGIGMNTPKETADRVAEIARMIGKVPIQYPEIGGAGYMVDRILLPDKPEQSELYETIRDSALRHGVEMFYLRSDMTERQGDIRMSLFDPVDDGDLNERCLSVKLSIDDYDVLITGDSPAWVEERLMARGDLHDLELIIVGHHGSADAGSQALLDGCGADTAVISVGYNYYGHPSQDVLERLKANGYTVYRTDENGTVSIRIGRDHG